jgi:DNA repair protein RecO (recombination protein O)
VHSRTYRTEGIVIKRINFGEADKILTLFTKHYGKIHSLAKGIRKLTSRKSASLELFNLVVVFLVKGKNLDLITEVQTIDYFSSWRKNLRKVSLAYQFCELTERLTAENQANILVFNLLRDSLIKLKEVKLDKQKLLLDFKKQLLKATGFGLPTPLTNKQLDLYIEQIIEKRINSNSLLKRVNRPR